MSCTFAHDIDLALCALQPIFGLLRENYNHRIFIGFTLRFTAKSRDMRNF